jgi:hypothetical protein
MKIERFDKFRPNKGPKGKDLSKFVRFGGLDLKNQKGYGSDTFHAPPATRGFYAFPKCAQEFFLIGSMDKFQPGTMPKDPDWSKLSGEEATKVSTQHDKKRRKILQNIRKEFTKTDGNIWHHLGEFCKPVDIIDRHGSWVKTTIEIWQKAFSKSSLNNRYGEDFMGDKFSGGKGRGIDSVNSARGINGMYCRDNLEVFFDEKV